MRDRGSRTKFALFAFATFVIVVPGCGGCCGMGGGGCHPDPVYPYDASPYYGYDFGPYYRDAGRDFGATRDLGVSDIGPDMHEVAPCFVGLACDPVRGCNGGQQCQPPLGGAPGIDVGLPDGGTTTLSEQVYQNGYCTNAALTAPNAVEGAAGACDPSLASDDPALAGMDGCLSCAKCVELPFARTLPTDPPYVQCMQRCTPSATDSGGCRTPGYTCNAATHTCDPFGCQSDLDCRIVPEDTNGDGVFDLTGGDRYVVDAASMATCNTATGRCDSPPVPLARAGDPCTSAATCELDGVCIDALTQGWPGGYCSRLGCDIPGRECPTDDKCQDIGGAVLGGRTAPTGDFRCVKPCTVNAEDPSLALGAGGHGDTCRPGYACVYDDSSPVGATSNGACEPGNYDAVTTNDFGAVCNSNADCYSPHGLGQCIFTGAARSCSLLGCAGFPDSAAICGAGRECHVFSDFTSACLVSCTTPADCAWAGAPAVDACIQLDTTHPGHFCFPACTTDADCQVGHTCTGASTTTAGTCSP